MKKNESLKEKIIDALSEEEEKVLNKIKSEFDLIPKKSVEEKKEKEKNFKQADDVSSVLSNALGVLQQKSNALFFLIAAAFFGLLYLFFYGVFTVPVLELGFFKTNPPSVLDFIYIFGASIISAATFALLRHSSKAGTGKGFFAGGVLGGAFGIVCPVCLGANILILGNVISLPLAGLVPYLGVFQAASIGLLAAGFWFASKSLDCKTCFIEPKHKLSSGNPFFDLNPLQSFSVYAMFFIAVGVLIFQALPATGLSFNNNSDLASVISLHEEDHSLNIDKIVSEVVPNEGFTINAKWSGAVKAMVDKGALDPKKLEAILTRSYGQEMKPEWKKILAGEAADEFLSINAENSVFMMYVLWALGKHNENSILSSSPFASSFRNYDIGVGRAGYGDEKILVLTANQQKVAEKVSLNSYRPCCGNSTGNPDCSHGFAALGLIELMASQGFTEKEIFEDFIKFNSFWFPSTYIQNAIYFKLAEEKDWSEIDKELLAGKQFSSVQGKYAVQKYLQDAGV